MDNQQFDRLVQALSQGINRRGALAVLGGIAAAGVDEATGKHRNRNGKGGNKARPAGRRKETDKIRGESQGNNKNNGKNQDLQNANATSCYSGTNCSPGKGKNNTGCDFSYDRINFVNRDIRGSNLTGVSFAGTNLSGAKLQSANLSKVCFVDANLKGANLGGTNTSTAIFCRTTMPDGTVNNSGCAKGTICCPTETCQSGCGECQECRSGKCVDIDGDLCDYVNSNDGICAGSHCEFFSADNTPSPYFEQNFTFDDLQFVNSSVAAVQQKFMDHFQTTKKPGLCVNEQVRLGGYVPGGGVDSICEEYGHWCTKKAGPFTYRSGGVVNTGGLRSCIDLVNNLDHEVTLSRNVDAEWNKEQNWKFEATAGVKYTGQVQLEGVLTLGSEFSLSVTGGIGGSTSQKQSVGDTITVPVPARSKIEACVVGVFKKEEMHFSAPISVQGYFGGNFPDRVQDHYFWFLPASTVLPQTSGTLAGTISDINAYDIHLEVSEAQSLS